MYIYTYIHIYEYIYVYMCVYRYINKHKNINKRSLTKLCGIGEKISLNRLFSQ